MDVITLDIGIALGAVVAIIGAVIGTGVALAGQLRADRAEAAADRRAFQAGMDDFRKEMQRLAERQSRIEGVAAD